MNFEEFLERVDEWSFDLSKRHEHYNPERVKSNILGSFEDDLNGLPKIRTNSHIYNKDLHSRALNEKRKYFSTIDTIKR